MKLLDMTCPHCGAGMKVTDNAKTIHCEYCNHDFIVDDEAIHIAHHIEDAEQLGYDMEAGRQRFRQEQKELEERFEDVLCPYCGAINGVDITRESTVCCQCKKQFNIQAGKAFFRANSASQFGDATIAIDEYDRALKLQGEGDILIKERNSFRNLSFTSWFVCGVIICIILFFFVDSTVAVIAGFVAFVLGLIALRKASDNSAKPETDTPKSELNINPEIVSSVRKDTDDGYCMLSELDTPPIIPIPEDCQQKLLEIDWLMDKYKNDDNMMAYLRDKQAEWTQFLFEAQTEEDDM